VRRFRIWVLSVLAGMLAACGGSAPVAAPAGSGAAVPSGVSGRAAATGTLAGLVQGARKEGRLDLVFSEDTIGGAETATEWADGFNQLYGLNLTVQFTPGPSMPEMAAKVAQEYATNRPATTDVFLGAETHIISLLKAEALQPVDWTSWATNVTNPQIIAPGNVAVEVLSATPGITYNGAKIKAEEAPASLQDLLNPRFKGHIASTPYTGVFEDLATPEMWGQQRTLDFLKAYSQQVSGLMRSGDIQRLANGEFDIMAINTDGSAALRWQAKGVPLQHVVPSDAPFVQFRYMGVPKNSAHPNAAQLFINYVVSRPGQDILYKHAFSDHYLLPGSHSGAALDRLKASGVALKELNVQFVQRNAASMSDAFAKQAAVILAKG